MKPIKPQPVFTLVHAQRDLNVEKFTAMFIGLMTK
jgi:hypothetical protein